MKISFLVIYYNQKDYVKKSLDSIISLNKNCDWEVLIGDDGSTDGTIEEIEKYTKKYDNMSLYVMPRDERTTPNPRKRVSDNRLNLLTKASGDLFCVMDGDDFYCSNNFLDDALNVFNRYENVSTVMFGFKYYTNGFYSKPKVLPSSQLGFVDKKTYVGKYYIHAGSCVFRKCISNERIELFKKHGGFDDFLIVLNNMNYGELYAIDEAIYAYRQTGQSVYTKMDKLEQSLYRIQGLDVGKLLVDKTYEEYLVERYSHDLVDVLMRKREISKCLDQVKIEQYIDDSSQINDSYIRFFLANKKSIKVYSSLFNVVLKKRKYIINTYILGNN